jgi:excisionase family DNA binding protein
MAETPDEFMTAEVASVLKLNQQTVRNWIDQGKRPPLRAGRRVRIRRTDFQKLVDDSYTVRSSDQSQTIETFTAEDFREGTKPHPSPTHGP